MVLMEMLNGLHLLHQSGYMGTVKMNSCSHLPQLYNLEH